MKKVLVTGGTVFVSRYVAEYFVGKGFGVYVLNRNNRAQSDGVILINTDRHDLGTALMNQHFDAIIDVTAYDEKDIEDLLDSEVTFDQYVFISSSAVYPEYAPQPFLEDLTLGKTSFGVNTELTRSKQKIFC